ncbi:unnamed protein product [Microthlaspi erraticum]|uniref:F-box domain-containing protein n=1 Tax=Microthlaspi erraticum TaxID=1685480 RepID=A0A6D2HI00_9BRAS|nr:unnamed protein product [Microthlaspi erraticum]
MKTRRREYVSEDGLTVSRRKSTNAKGENSETISADLMIEIFLRLPRKSVARCRCVSKLWNSTLHSPYFIEFLTRPRLLFSFRKDRELYFFSSPQDANSSPVDADYHLKLKLEDSFRVCGHVRGLVCLDDLRVIKERKETAPVICNPRTGQLLPLPKVKTERRVGMWSFLGFDPTDEEFKVLTITRGVEHRVLTLGTRKLEWRMIECGIPRHYPRSDGICINGGVYYRASVNRYAVGIVCFDVRLGVFIEESRHFELWVLVDAERHEWSKHVSVLPQPLWERVVAEQMLYIVGVAGGTDEVVWWPRYGCAPFYVYYYNMERNTFRRVEIKGMYVVRDYADCMTLDYVEDLKLMEHV